MYKKVLLFILLAGMLLTVAACTGAQPAADTAQTDGTGGAADATGAPIVLKFISWQVDESGVGDWWNKAIAEFESAHPGVKIEFTKVGRDQYVDTMTTLFVSGDAPEIVHLASFEYPQFADQGWLEDLDPWVEQSDLDLNGWAGQEKCVWNGETDCIMLLYFGFVMVYNQGMFEEAGLDVPTNYEEYLAAARALTKDTDGDGIIEQFGTGHHTVAGNQYLTEMLNYVVDTGAYWTDAEGKAAVNTPEMIEALGHWKTILQENLTPLDLGAGDIRQLLAEGKIAMHPDGPWIWGIVKGAEPEVFEQLKFARVPFTVPVGGSSNVIAMKKDMSQEKKELVWDFIELITSQPYQEDFALLGGMPAPRPNAVPANIYEEVPHFDLLVEAQQEAAAAGIDRLPKGLETDYNEFAKIVIEQMQNMIINDLPPEEVANTLQQLTEELQARE